MVGVGTPAHDFYRESFMDELAHAAGTLMKTGTLPFLPVMIGAVLGAVLGAFSYVLLQEWFSALTKHWLLLMGGFVIVAVMLLPGGLTRAGDTWHAWRANSKSPTASWRSCR